MNTRKWMLAAVAAAVTISIARAQDPAGNANAANANANANQARAGAQGGTAGKAAVSDALFAQAAAASGLAEVAISNIGLQRAANNDLKTFSRRMIDDHTKANSELMALAARKGIALPTALDSRAQFCGQNLAGLSGEDFDRCYAKAQLVAHMEAVATFEAEAERGQDPEVKAWASRTLPKLREHLAMVRPWAEKAEKEKPSADQKHDEKADNNNNNSK